VIAPRVLDEQALEELDPSAAASELLGLGGLRKRFEVVHEQRYGYSDEHAPVELVNVRVSAWGARPTLALHSASAHDATRPQARLVRFAGEWVSCAVLHGEPVPGSALHGPAVFALAEATLLVPPG